MKFDIVTIFPTMVEAPLAEGIVGRAIARGILNVAVSRSSALHIRSSPDR